MIDATSKAAKAGDALKAEQFATATGIFYDKLVPQPRSGAVSPLVGAVRQVNIMVPGSPDASASPQASSNSHASSPALCGGPCGPRGPHEAGTGPA